MKFRTGGAVRAIFRITCSLRNILLRLTECTKGKKWETKVENVHGLTVAVLNSV